MITAVALRLVPAVAARAVAWAGVESPKRALDLLRFLEARTSSVEGFELVPEDSLQLVLKHIPGTRAPLAGDHKWHVLVEATTTEAAADIAAELEGLLAAALEQGIIGDAVLAANEAQAEAFWKIRDTISEAERAEGQTLAHDVSVPVADMPRFIVDASAEVERRFSGRDRERFRPSRRRQHPFPRPRRQPRCARLVRERGRGDHPFRRRFGDCSGWLDFR